MTAEEQHGDLHLLHLKSGNTKLASDIEQRSLSVAGRG